MSFTPRIDTWRYLYLNSISTQNSPLEFPIAAPPSELCCAWLSSAVDVNCVFVRNVRLPSWEVCLGKILLGSFSPTRKLKINSVRSNYVPNVDAGLLRPVDKRVLPSLKISLGSHLNTFGVAFCFGFCVFLPFWFPPFVFASCFL